MAFISIEEANGYVRRCLSYKESYQSSLEGPEEDYNFEERYFASPLISFVFNKQEIDAMFANTDADSLRVYYGARTTGEPTIVLVAAKVINPSVENTLVNGAIETPIPPTQGRGGGGKGDFNILIDNVA